MSSDESMGTELTFDEKIKFTQAGLDIYTTVFYKGHKSASSGKFRHLYERISELYLGMGDKENGIKYLRLAAEAAEYFDKNCSENIKYSSIFVNRINANSEKHYIDTVRLLQLMDMREAFDIIRDTDEFKDIHSHLVSLSPKE